MSHSIVGSECWKCSSNVGEKIVRVQETCGMTSRIVPVAIIWAVRGSRGVVGSSCQCVRGACVGRIFQGARAAERAFLTGTRKGYTEQPIVNPFPDYQQPPATPPPPALGLSVVLAFWTLLGLVFWRLRGMSDMPQDPEPLVAAPEVVPVAPAGIKYVRPSASHTPLCCCQPSSSPSPPPPPTSVLW